MVTLVNDNASPLLERAGFGIRPSTRQWPETAKNYVEFANEGGQYDEIKQWFSEGGAKKKAFGFGLR